MPPTRFCKSIILWAEIILLFLNNIPGNSYKMGHGFRKPEIFPVTDIQICKIILIWKPIITSKLFGQIQGEKRFLYDRGRYCGCGHTVRHIHIGCFDDIARKKMVVIKDFFGNFTDM